MKLQLSTAATKKTAPVNIPAMLKQAQIEFDKLGVRKRGDGYSLYYGTSQREVSLVLKDDEINGTAHYNGNDTENMESVYHISAPATFDTISALVKWARSRKSEPAPFAKKTAKPKVSAAKQKAIDEEDAVNDYITGQMKGRLQGAGQTQITGSHSYVRLTGRDTTSWHYEARANTSLGFPNVFKMSIPPTLAAFKKVHAWLDGNKYEKPPFAVDDGTTNVDNHDVVWEDKVPAGYKIVGYEIFNPRSLKTIAKGEATSEKQIHDRMRQSVPMGMTVNLITKAVKGTTVVKVRENFTVQQKSIVPAASGPAAVSPADKEQRNQRKEFQEHEAAVKEAVRLRNEKAKAEKERQEAEFNSPEAVAERMDKFLKASGFRFINGTYSLEKMARSIIVKMDKNRFEGTAHTDLGILRGEENMSAPQTFVIDSPIYEEVVNQWVLWVDGSKYEKPPRAVAFKVGKKEFPIRQLEKHVRNSEAPAVVTSTPAAKTPSATSSRIVPFGQKLLSYRITSPTVSHEILGNAATDKKIREDVRHYVKLWGTINLRMSVEPKGNSPTEIVKSYTVGNGGFVEIPYVAPAASTDEFEFEEPAKPARPANKPVPKVEQVKPVRMPKVKPAVKPAEPIKHVKPPKPRVEQDVKPAPAVKITVPRTKPTPTVKPETAAKAPAKVTAKVIENLGIYAYTEMSAQLKDVMKNTFAYKGKEKNFSVTLIGAELNGTATVGGKKYAISLPASVANLKTLHKWAKGKSEDLPPFAS